MNRRLFLKVTTTVLFGLALFPVNTVKSIIKINKKSKWIHTMAVIPNYIYAPYIPMMVMSFNDDKITYYSADGKEYDNFDEAREKPKHLDRLIRLY